VTSSPSGELSQFTGLMRGFDMIQLAHQLGPALPQRPGSPGFEYRLSDPHDKNGPRLDRQMPGSTSAADQMTVHIHTGTHIDSLAHIALDGRLADGSEVFTPGAQDEWNGIRMQAAETMTPIAGRAVLLDFAEHLNVSHAPGDYVITAGELERAAERQGVTFGPGDVVFLRTGRDTLAADPDAFYAAPFPGIDTTAAQRLAHAGIAATGSDTFAFEASQLDVALEPHVELIVRAGIFILEGLDLRELAARKCREFVVVIAPLRIAGATGSPVNPLAFIPAPAVRTGHPA